MRQAMQKTENETHHIHLREAQEADLPLLASILHQAFAEYRDRLDPPSGVHHETEETLGQKMQKGGAVLAYLGDNPVGCVFFRVESDYMYLGRLSVLPQHRKRGIARTLINEIEQRAIALHLPRVQLGVRTALPDLRAYYEQLGYRPVRFGTHEGYSEPTYVEMEKDLSHSQASST